MSLDRTEISFGGCLSVTSEGAPSNICVSQMRSSTWSRKRWCLRAAGEVVPSRTKCRAREEEEVAEVREINSQLIKNLFAAVYL